jgi:hypothetical protein
MMAPDRRVTLTETAPKKGNRRPKAVGKREDKVRKRGLHRKTTATERGADARYLTGLAPIGALSS